MKQHLHAIPASALVACAIALCPSAPALADAPTPAVECGPLLLQRLAEVGCARVVEQWPGEQDHPLAAALLRDHVDAADVDLQSLAELGCEWTVASADVGRAAALDDATELDHSGQPGEAAALLRRLAEEGSVAAMERLALMHLYGPTLYPEVRWQAPLARHWLEQAAAGGSALAAHMLARTGQPLRLGAR